MNRVLINLEALGDNLKILAKQIGDYGGSYSVVSKALSGHQPTLKALIHLGVRSFNDTRLQNLRTIGELCPDAERWLLRPPMISAADEVVQFSEVSLNSEYATVEALDQAAARRGLVHSIVAMIELGDLREGLPPGELLDFCQRVAKLDHVRLLGIGGQVGCVSGLAPTPDHVAQLQLYRQLVESTLGSPLKVLSAGSTMFLPMLADGKLPPGVGHFRIGEAIYLGSNLISGGVLPPYNNDVIRLEAEVVEIKEKSLIPLGQTVEGTPFEPLGGEDGGAASGLQRGYRALIAIGQLDTEVSGLEPENPNYRIAGASSDIAVLNIGRDAGDLKVGDTLRFKTGYSAFVRLMAAPYIDKVVTPDLASFMASAE